MDHRGEHAERDVVPVTFAVPDFDMSRREKLFDFVSGVGSSAALETTLGLKSPD